MSRIIPLAVALAMTAAPAALAQDHGRGHGGEKGGGAERGQGQGRGQQAREDRGGPPQAAREQRAEGGPERNDNGNRGGPDRDHGPDRDRPDRVIPVPMPVPVSAGREPERVVRDIVRFEPRGDRGLIAGCPPGLARKDNGCLPPGQARRIEAERRARYDYVWDRMARDGYRYRYDDGYLYRVNSSGGLLGWLPVLGGALSTGSVWPTQYSYQPAPTYYTNYYRLPDRYDYRYADGVLYGVDRQNNGISQIAALLTGQQWTVGQAMPSGYDIYNVPYDYRARYADTPDRWYRYNDGYVYQVDPTTRLVQAVIQLLA
jgi:hypothetical protein